jgi:hypothetical protein
MVHVHGLDNALLVHVVECVPLVQTDRADKKSVEGAESHTVDGNVMLLLKAVIDRGGSC